MQNLYGLESAHIGTVEIWDFVKTMYEPNTLLPKLLQILANVTWGGYRRKNPDAADGADITSGI